MSGSAKSFTFGPFYLDLSQRLLLRDGRPVSLSPKATMILCLLLERHGKLVEREELMRHVWPDAFVEEGNLTVNIFALRKVLAEGFGGEPCIETIPRRGYRFIAPVEESGGHAEGESSDPAAARALSGETSGAASPAVLPGRTEPPAGSIGTSEGYLSTSAGPGESRFDPGVRPERGRKPGALLIGLCAVAIVAAFLVWKVFVPAPPRVEAVHRLTDFGLASGVVTDGKHVYVEVEKFGRYSIAEITREEGLPSPIRTRFPNTRLLDISPDGADLLLAGYAKPGDPWKVWVFPLDNSTPRRLGDVASGSARWSPDGSRIAFERDDGALCTVRNDGTGEREILADGGRIDGWSRDGGRVEFTRLDSASGATSLWEVRADGTHLQPLFPERVDPKARWGAGQNLGRWTPGGRYFLFREGSQQGEGIWAVRTQGGFFGLRRPKPVEIYSAGFSIQGAAMQPDGKQLLLVGRTERRALVRYDPHMREFLPILPNLPPIAFLRWSPDGQSIVYTTLTGSVLWRARADGSQRTQLTVPPMAAFNPVWSPDGKWLEFHVLMPGKPGKICLMPAQGGAPKMLLANQPTEEDGPNWSPDGKTLMFDQAHLDKEGKTTDSAIVLMDLKTGRVRKLPGGEGMNDASWSPDGRYVAATADDSTKLMLYDFGSGKWSRIASGGYLYLPTWARDSRSFYFQDRAGGEGQPIYRYVLASRKVEEVTSEKNVIGVAADRYVFKGLTPDSEPVAAVIDEGTDIYSLNLELP